MSKLIIIRGNSGSGKTSLAKSLQRKLGRNTMMISQDYIRREMLWVHDRIENKAIPLLEELIKYGKRNSEFVILEGILYSDYYLRLFKKAMEEFDSEIFAYYYDLSFEETIRRHKSKSNSSDFGEEDMRKWWREEDLIGIISESRINSNLSIPDAVSMIYEDVVKKKD